MKIRFLLSIFFFSFCACCAFSQDSKFRPTNQQIPVPDCLNIKGLVDGYKACTAEDHRLWLADITHWRNERRIRIGYNGSRYEMPELRWTQSSFMQPQMMVQDRFFYDPVAGNYTVDRYLDDLQQRYGGIDAVLIWPTYPNMGIDNRNQHDMIRCMPGGVAGVRQMIADFHKRGVRVLFPAFRRGARVERDDLGAVSVSVYAAGGQVQVARAAAYGQHFRPLESKQGE